MPVDYNCHGISETVLETAAYAHKKDLIILLISLGANTRNAMYTAALHGDWAVLDTLVTAGGDCAKDPRIIRYALVWGPFCIVSKLLSAGAVLPTDSLDVVMRSHIDQYDKIECIRKIQKI